MYTHEDNVYLLQQCYSSNVFVQFLFSSVGERGTVTSFEVNKKHLDVAMENYSEWVHCVRLHKDKQMVENVVFYNKDLTHVEEIIDGLVDAVCVQRVYVYNLD